MTLDDIFDQFMHDMDSGDDEFGLGEGKGIHTDAELDSAWV